MCVHAGNTLHSAMRLTLYFVSTASTLYPQLMFASLTMPEAVTLPVFGSASNQAAAEGNTSGTSSEWQMDSSNDPMDFDLLAEYLLEDNTTSSTGLNFDFK